jgi:hypothetical protein
MGRSKKRDNTYRMSPRTILIREQTQMKQGIRSKKTQWSVKLS